MPNAHAKGGNFEIDIERGVAFCRVWKRPEVTREEGASFAEEKVRLLGALASAPKAHARALIFDLREAPPLWGPATQESLEKIVSAWEKAQKRVAVVVGEEAIQRLQMKRILAERAKIHGKMAPSLPLAWTWVDTK